MTTKTATGIRVTRCLAVPALAMGLAIGSASVANALPEWDIGAYDRCIANIPTDVIVGEYGEDAIHECCVKTGGVWNPNKPYGNCEAPPVESQGRNPLPNEAPTHVIQPLSLIHI